MTDSITTLDLITLAQEYRGNIVRQINRSTTFLKMVKIVAGEGKNVAWATEADGALGVAYTDGADVTDFSRDVQDSAILTWGLYLSSFHVSQLSMDAAATSATPAGNMALWARNLQNAAAKLAAVVNVACYTGLGTSGLLGGLDVAIGSATNTYAGINRSTGSNAYFRPIVVDPGSSTAPTMSLLRDDIRQIYESCGENPDLALVNPAGFNKVGSLFDATRRQTVDAVSVARGLIKLDFGFHALEVDGTMFMKDKDATAGSLYYLNTNHIELQYLPSVKMSGLPTAEVEADDGFGEVPLGMHYEMLAKTGTAEKALVRTQIQMKVERPNSCGVRLHLNTAA